jgi:hypothetical protein
MLCKRCKTNKNINVGMNSFNSPTCKREQFHCPICGFNDFGGPNPIFSQPPQQAPKQYNFTPYMTQAQATAYVNTWYKTTWKASPDVPKLKYELTHNDTIVAIKFLSIPSKGWWKANVQPALDFIKALVPATMRSYNNSTFIWEVAIEYWPACKTALETAFHFTCVEGSITTASADPLKGVNIPKQYAENFYHKPEPIVQKEDAATIAAKLSEYLGVKIHAQELSELKKLYRAKARELHPDMGGDASKMSELNRLWTLYTSGGVN